MSGFKKIREVEGVGLYRRGYLLVQVVNLERARLVLAHGGIKVPRIGKGVFGGDDPKVGFRSLRVYWRALRIQHGERLFSLVNGMFWRVSENPARLTMPVKIDGKMITDGFDVMTYIERGKASMLELYQDRAVIQPLSGESLYTSKAPDIIAGLNWTASRRKMDYTGRTVIGVDESGKTVFILSSGRARQNEAKKALRDDFGAAESMMLDGGGSSQLMVVGHGMVYSSRAIPQVVGVVSGRREYKAFVPFVGA